jgi:hypothetical protein
MRLIIAAWVLIALCVIGAGQANKEESFGNQGDYEENIVANELPPYRNTIMNQSIIMY